MHVQALRTGMEAETRSYLDRSLACRYGAKWVNLCPSVLHMIRCICWHTSISKDCRSRRVLLVYLVRSTEFAAWKLWYKVKNMFWKRAMNGMLQNANTWNLG